VSGNTSLTWTVHLARRRPRQAAAVVALILLAGTAAGYGFQSLLLGLLAAALLTASVADYLFPVRCRLDESGIHVRGLLHRRRMEWRQVRRATKDEFGVKLSPLPRPSRLEAYRGIYLWFADNADQAMAIIAHYRAPEAAGGDDLSPS
jgi:hypothetical protein